MLRRNLVFSYKDQSEEEVDKILEAKARDAHLRGGPLMQLLGWPDRSEARRRSTR